jgi:cellulose synthase/poly-beta-1,6-N-acetylglucosamine synthase-like glycosyltransferase
MQSRELYKTICERDEARAELERAHSGVTVVITYHNEAHEILERAWSSVVVQTLKPYELVIVDDGSAPALGSWHAAAAFPTRLVGITNRGLPAARNTGLMLACTEAILFLDADDWLEPTFLEKTLPALADADVVLTGLQEHGPVRKGCYMPGYDKPFEDVTLEDLWVMNRLFYCALFRTSTLREIGGYNPLMAGAWNQNGGYEDHDLWLDLMTRGARFTAVKEPLFNYSTETLDSMVHRAQGNRDALHAEMRRHHRR